MKYVYIIVILIFSAVIRLKIGGSFLGRNLPSIVLVIQSSWSLTLANIPIPLKKELLIFSSELEENYIAKIVFIWN